MKRHIVLIFLVFTVSCVQAMDWNQFLEMEEMDSTSNQAPPTSASNTITIPPSAPPISLLPIDISPILNDTAEKNSCITTLLTRYRTLREQQPKAASCPYYEDAIIEALSYLQLMKAFTNLSIHKDPHIKKIVVPNKKTHFYFSAIFMATFVHLCE